MNRLTLIGVVLVVLGLAGFLFPRIVFTEQETVIDVGPLQVEAERQRSVTIPDVASGAAVAAGVILAAVGANRKG